MLKTAICFLYLLITCFGDTTSIHNSPSTTIDCDSTGNSKSISPSISTIESKQIKLNTSSIFPNLIVSSLPIVISIKSLYAMMKLLN